MKKLLSLVLTLVLMASLTAPALALSGSAQAVPVPEAQDVWDTLRVQKPYSGDETQQSAWLAAHPDEAAAFDPYAWFEDNYYYYDSVEEYMEGWELESTADFEANMLSEWVYTRMEEESVQTQRDQRISSLGGVPGQINVMVDGKCLSFGAKAPKQADGVLSVPADVLSKVLDTQVKGDAQGYAPLRSTAEGAGWEVLWDQEYETAVLVHQAALTAELKKEFSQLDALFARLMEQAKPEPGQNYRTQFSADFALTLFDTLNGDKTHNIKMRSEALVRDGGFSATLTLDAASLLSLVTNQQVKELFGSGMSLSKLTDLAKSLKIELIYNSQGEMLYLKAPILAQLTGGKAPALGEWLSLDLGGLVQAENPVPSELIASLLYRQALSETSYGYWTTPIEVYERLADLSAPYITVVGNGRFTEKNGTLSYSLDAKTVNGLLNDTLSGDYGDEPTLDVFKSCDFTLSAGKDGRMDVNVDIESDYGQMGSVGVFTSFLVGNLRYRAQANGTAEANKGSLEFHWQNHLALKCDIDSQRSPVSEAPRSAPAAGDKVTSLEDLDDLLYDAGYEDLYYLLP